MAPRTLPLATAGVARLVEAPDAGLIDTAERMIVAARWGTSQDVDSAQALIFRLHFASHPPGPPTAP